MQLSPKVSSMHRLSRFYARVSISGLVVLVALTVLLGFSLQPELGFVTLLLALYWLGISLAGGLILLSVGAIRFVRGR